MDRSRSPHISSAEVRRLAESLEDAPEEAKGEIATRLAWRPAWAIRSRRGVLATLREMFGRRKKPD